MQVTGSFPGIDWTIAVRQITSQTITAVFESRRDNRMDRAAERCLTVRGDHTGKTTWHDLFQVKR